MRNAWLKTIAVLICSAGLASPALADPGSMVMRAPQVSASEGKSIWPWSKKEQPAPTPPPFSPYAQPAPSEQTSFKKHPIQYLKTTVSTPFSKKGASAPRPMAPPAQQHQDPIALSTPTGAPSPELFMYAAQTCEQQNDVENARANLKRALSMWPGHPEVLRAAAHLEDRQGQLPLAESLYLEAVKSNPQHAGAFNDLGLCLAKQGKLEASVQVLEQAVQLQPSKALYRNNVATVLVVLHQDQKALAHLAAVHGPAEANFSLGQLLVERNRGAEAAPYFQAALQLNPGMQPAQEALAKLQGSQLAVTAPVATPVATPVAPAAPAQQVSAGQQFQYPTTATQPQMTQAPAATQTQYLPPVATRPAMPGQPLQR